MRTKDELFRAAQREIAARRAACRHAGRDRPPRRLRRQSGAFCCR